MNAMSFAEMGLSAVKRRQFDAAINMLRQALSEENDNLDARFGLARSLHEKGSLTEALGEYRTVLQSDGGHMDCLYHIARALLQNDDPREALNHLDIALRSQPTAPELLTLRGQILLTLEQPDTALSTLQTAAHHQPGSENIHRLIAKCHRANHDAETERRAIEQLLRIAPSSLTASNDMGVLNLREGHLIAAFEAFEQILSQDPEHGEATLNRAIALTVMGGMDHQAIWDRVMTVCDGLDGLDGLDGMDGMDETRALADQLAQLPDDRRKGSDAAAALIERAAQTEIPI